MSNTIEELAPAVPAPVAAAPAPVQAPKPAAPAPAKAPTPAPAPVAPKPAVMDDEPKVASVAIGAAPLDNDTKAPVDSMTEKSWIDQLFYFLAGGLCIKTRD